MKREYKKGRIFMGRLPFGGDLLLEVEKAARENGVRVGFVRVIGAVSRGVFSYYDQVNRVYRHESLDQQLEVLSCQGNISLRDGQVKAHLHVVYSDEKGRCTGGHLGEGAIIFAGEFYLEELLGEELSRGFDETTGLPLWDM